jgi:predicted dehydrogenase
VDFSVDWQADAQAVMIGSNPQTHFELASKALEAGKHVLMEKPMTIDPAHSAELARIAKSKNVVLAVVHNFQFSRASRKLREVLAGGKLGAVRAIYAVQLSNHSRKIHDWCDQLPLGLFFDEAPHFYYMLRWLAGGELTLLDASVWRDRKGKNTPHTVSGEYRSPRDFPVFVHFNFESSITEWNITVVGENGTVNLDMWRDIYTYLPNDGVHTAVDITRTSVYATMQHLWGVFTGGLRHVRGAHLYGNDEVVSRFHRAINGEDSLAGMDPSEGKRVVEMMHEIIAKARYH